MSNRKEEQWNLQGFQKKKDIGKGKYLKRKKHNRKTCSQKKKMCVPKLAMKEHMSERWYKLRKELEISRTWNQTKRMPECFSMDYLIF